jgi:hypothetical protein
MSWALWLAFGLVVAIPALAQSGDPALKQETSSIRVTFDARQPGLSALRIDALKQDSFRPSPIVDPGAEPIQYTVNVRNGWVQYALSSDPKHAVWEMRAEGDTLRLRSLFNAHAASHDLTWKFNPDVTHATLLGHVTKDGDIALPAVLHLPGMGSLRIYASASLRCAPRSHSLCQGCLPRGYGGAQNG